MIKSKYMRNSRIHRALEKLRLAPQRYSDIKKMIVGTTTQSRFDDEIMSPLLNDKFIILKDDFYHLTKDGEEKYVELGAVIAHTKHGAPSNTINKVSGLYVMADSYKDAMRPGANDHFNHPSRIGDKLTYRNGYVVTL